MVIHISAAEWIGAPEMTAKRRSAPGLSEPPPANG